MAERNLTLILKAKDEASGTVNKLAGAAENVGKAAAWAAGVGIAALGAGLTFSVKAAADAEKVTAQLDAVLRSTGGGAGVTASAVTKLSDELSRLTPFEDEAITSAQSMLLTFTNIGSNIFPQATETILNMSTALGQDLQSSAIQVGKALNDPIMGVTALRRVGVQLSDQQEQAVKDFMAVNDIASAQAVILGELETQFGGSARAAGQTFAGQLTILQTQLGNVAEEIGVQLLPILLDLVREFSAFLNSDEGRQWMTDMMTAMRAVAGFMTNDLIPAIKQVVQWIKEAITTLQQLQALWGARGDIAGAAAGALGERAAEHTLPGRIIGGGISLLQSATDPTFGFGGGVRNAAGARQAAALMSARSDISAGERRRRARREMGRMGLSDIEGFGPNEFIDALRNLRINVDGQVLGRVTGQQQGDLTTLLARMGV